VGVGHEANYFSTERKRKRGGGGKKGGPKPPQVFRSNYVNYVFNSIITNAVSA